MSGLRKPRRKSLPKIKPELRAVRVARKMMEKKPVTKRRKVAILAQLRRKTGSFI
jgi:hypothetical protein